MIRKYKPEDIEAVLDVWYKSSSLAHPFMTEEFKTKEKDNIRNIYIPSTETWVYEKGKTVVGFIGMLDNEVGAIFVDPQFHGLGIGYALMNHVSELFEELEVEVFKTNTIGRNFYNKYGFEFIKEHLHKETGQQLLRLKYKKSA